MRDKATSSPKTRSYHRDWTQGPLLGNLLQLSWPMIVMESLFVISQVVDMIWIGRLGPSSIAGVGIANIVIMLVMAMDFGLIVGVRAMVARFVGAGDLKAANHVAAQALILSGSWGALITIGGISLAAPVMGLFGLEAGVISEGMAYMRIMFAGWIAMDLLVMSLYVIQSAGDTIRPMMIEAFMRIIHVTLCPFLVLGIGIFPKMGVSGAALSNVLSQGLGSVLCLLILLGGHTRLHLSGQDFKIDLNIIWRILKIGVPALVMNIQRSFGTFILTYLMAVFGTIAVAAHSLVSRLEMFVMMPSMALSMGAGVLVGQNLGAGQPERAEKSAWLTVAIVQVFMAGCSAAVFFWAGKVMVLFTADPGLLATSADFLRITAAAFLLMPIATVFQSCIASAGDTFPNMVISLAVMWLAQIPFAFILSRYAGLEAYGIRWALVVSSFVGTVVYFAYFRTGRWKLKKV